jgi:hypothetical protein
LNSLQVARLLLTSPTQAFTALKEKPAFALPMFLTLLFVTAMTVAYYAKVDIAWLNDQTFSAARNLTPQQQQLVASKMTRGVMLWSSAISAPIVLSIFMLLAATYCVIVGNITNVRYSFNHWFAFSWWAASPTIIGSIAALLTLLLSSSTQIPSSAMAPLSLNELVFHKRMGEPGYTFLMSVSLTQVVSLWLTYVGIKAWSGRSTTYCLLFTLLPYVILYGLWALFSFR